MEKWISGKKRPKLIEPSKWNLLEFSAPGRVRTATNPLPNESHASNFSTHAGIALKIFQSDDFFGPVRWVIHLVCFNLVCLMKMLYESDNLKFSELFSWISKTLV